MRFVSLASGSKGNASLLSVNGCNILIDCGITAKRIDESLKGLGLNGTEDIDAIMLTHEHSDHIRGLKRLMAYERIPVFATPGTLSSLSKVTGDEFFSYAGKELMNPVYADREFEISGIRIMPFSIYHDAAQPCGFRFESDQTPDDHLRKHVSSAVMTDCGHFDDYIADYLKGLDCLLLEANHDRAMLANGPYPVHLKRRIMSSNGHMSNNTAGQLLSEIISPKLKSILLGHLSEQNNTPEKAEMTVRAELRRQFGELAAQSIPVSVAVQNVISQVVEV